jgi:hypothetical protein
MSVENPLWGAPRIHGELLKLGFQVAQSTVAKYMAKRRGPPSQGWRTFLRNHAPDIAAIDLFVVPTIGFELLYGIVIMRLDRRHLVWTNVTTNPTAEWIARQITEHSPGIRHRAISFGTATGLTVLSSFADYEPWRSVTIRPRHARRGRMVMSNGSSARRECLDHIVVIGEASLRRTLKAYARYYNEVRTHRSLSKDAPQPRTIQFTGTIYSRPVLGGLHHHYVYVRI